MGTNALPQAAMGDPGFQKAADQASQGLAMMLKLCHKSNPESPLCDVLTQMVKAVGDIENDYESGGQGGDPMSALPAEDPSAMGDPAAMGGDPAAMGGEPPMDPGMEDPMAMQQPPSDMGPGPGGDFAQAAADTQAMMQAAKKRQS